MKIVESALFRMNRVISQSKVTWLRNFTPDVAELWSSAVKISIRMPKVCPQYAAVDTLPDSANLHL